MAWPDDLNDVALARHHLIGEKGFTPAEADAIIRSSPGIDQVLDLEQTKKRLRDELDARVQAEYARSPQGRAEAARAALETESKRKADAEAARALLRAEKGAAWGDEFLSSLSDEDALRAAGMVEGEQPKPAPQTVQLREGLQFVTEGNLNAELSANFAAAERSKPGMDWLAHDKAKEERQWGGEE